MRKQTPEIPSGSAPDRLSPELERLLRVGARRRQLSKNEVLYTRGSAPDSVFCVESGAVQLSATSVNGREAVLGVAEQGRWFGELTLFIAAPPNGSSVWVRVVDEVSGAIFEQEVTADLPAATQFLSPRLFLNTGATAAAVAYDCAGVYLETDF